MTRYKLPALAGALIGALATTSQAADMPELPVIKAPVQEFFSPWYVRLDGGWRVSSISDGSYFGSPFTDSQIADGGTIGGGFGMKWNWFRTDVTFDFGFQPKFEGFLGATPAMTANLTNYTMLWNGYVDLGTWWGFSPYVGVGIGFSHLTPINFQTVPVSTLAADNPGRAQFSWAGMAGLSYAISPGLLLDANYRYLELGEARSTVTPLGDVRYGDWTANEFRLGLRYLIQ